MKILAIRGKNLTALAGEFAVDFQVQPLASAGLFAITGPTGAGKSTLLDALCVALYERTPRLSRAGSRGESVPDVGEDKVIPADVRTLLRRGAAEGYAEVDFQGHDGLRYRARWSVRRARQKAEGRLQPTDMQLKQLRDDGSEGRILGDHRKTETLNLIQQKLGLDFEQFTRAVLLAQNDFSAFLKASDDDRAELLQTLTGTRTFTQLSIRAFQRAKAEAARLQALQSQLQQQQPLTEAERHTVMADVARCQALLQAEEQTILEKQAQARWWTENERLLAQQHKADAAVAEARALQHAAAPRLHHLHQLEAVQAARPLWQEVQRSEGRLHTHQAEGQQSQQQLVLAHQAVDAAQTDSARTQAQLHALAQERNALQAELSQARILDDRLSLLHQHLKQHETTRESTYHLREQLEKKKHTQQMKLDQAQQQLQTHTAWCDAHAAWQDLAQGWDKWLLLLQQTQQLTLDLQASDQKIQQHEAELQHAHAARQRAESALHTAQAHAKDCRTRAQAQQQALDQSTPPSIEAQRQCRDTVKAWREAAHLLADLQHHRHAQAQATQQHQAAQQWCEQMLQKKELLTQEKKALEASLIAKEQMLAQAQLATSVSAAQFRAHLRPEEPCPVCGATHHPYAELQSAADTLAPLLAQWTQEVNEARKTLTDTSNKLTATATRLSERQQQVLQLADTLAQHAQAHDERWQAWQAHPLYADWQAQHQHHRADAFQHWVAWQQAGEQAAQDAQSRLDHAQAAYTQAQAEHQRLHKAAAAAEAAQHHAQQAHTEAQHRCERLQQQLTQEQQRHRQKRESLEAIRCSLQPVWALIPAEGAWSARIAHAHRQVQAWQTHQQGRIDAQQQVQQLLAAQATVCAQLEQAQTSAQHAHEAWSQAHNDHQTALALRAAVLQGRPVQAVEQDWQNRHATAEHAHQAAQTCGRHAQDEATRLTEACRHHAQRIAQEQTALDAAQLALDDWLASWNATHNDTPPLDRPRLLAWLRVSPEWMAQERQALRELDEAVTHALAVAHTYRTDAQRHQEARAMLNSPMLDDAAAVDQALQTSLEKLKQLQAEQSALEWRLTQDDERLKATVALREQLAQQAEQEAVWARLSDLIGSADGKKFRNFAQQLTLDVLLGYANAHLQSLSRRYRLERVTDSLGLLVVDQDMGDEVRSVHSLSGGESFLVSLALALGLASLSSHRVQVETLFIDEGFGSLDADALQIALDALDQLQSQGRQVGVISHVQDMTERISTRIHLQKRPGGASRLVVLG
jgi:exonuclease SbcC